MRPKHDSVATAVPATRRSRSSTRSGRGSVALASFVTRPAPAVSRAITPSSRQGSCRRSSTADRFPDWAPNTSTTTGSRAARAIPFDWYSVRWTGSLTVPAGGVRRIGVEGNDGYRLYLDGKLLIDNWRKQSYGTRMANVVLRPGTRHDIRLEY